MDLKIKILSILIGLVFLLLVIRFIRKNNMRASYAVLWIGISIFLISIPFLDFFYIWLSYSVIGLIDARNIIYIGLIGFLLVYIFYLTSKISTMTDQIQELISHTAILANKLDRLEVRQTELPM